MKNKIIPNKEYAIKTNGDYFLKKYGQENPVIRIEDKAEKIFGENWKDTMNWAIIVFVKRMGRQKRNRAAKKLASRYFMQLKLHSLYDAGGGGLGHCVSDGMETISMDL